jgi:hypothetical protein
MPNRRDFLATAASGGLLAALPAGRSLPLHADETRPAPFLALDDTDLTWVSRLRGKSRAVFDSPEPSEGGALFRAALWRQQLNKVFGTPIEDVTPVVVFRHSAIPLVMDDAAWDHLGLGRDLKWKDPTTGKWSKINPIANPSPDAPAEFRDINIASFVKSGGIVLACGLAFGDMIAAYQQKDKLSEAEATTRAKEHLVPGIIIQPSGFFAVLKAQEEGCKYMMGS